MNKETIKKTFLVVSGIGRDQPPTKIINGIECCYYCNGVMKMVRLAMKNHKEHCAWRISRELIYETLKEEHINDT